MWRRGVRDWICYNDIRRAFDNIFCWIILSIYLYTLFGKYIAVFKTFPLKKKLLFTSCCRCEVNNLPLFALVAQFWPIFIRLWKAMDIFISPIFFNFRISGSRTKRRFLHFLAAFHYFMFNFSSQYDCGKLFTCFVHFPKSQKYKS